MSQFESTGPASAVRPNVAVPLPHPAAWPPLDAPGLVPVPAMSPGQALAAEALKALGVLGDAGQEAAQYARTNRALADAEKRAVSGLASRDARVDLPGYLSAIKERRFIVPDDADPATYFREALNTRLADNPDPEYRQAFIDATLPHLVAAHFQQQAEIKADHVRDVLGTLRDDAIQATNSAGVGAAYTAAGKLDPTLSETDKLNSIVVPALRSAAAAGDAGRLKAASEWLGDRLPAERQAAQAVFEAKQRENQARAERDAREDFNGYVESGATPDLLREIVSADKRLDDHAKAELLGHVTIREREQLGATQSLMSNNLLRDIGLGRYPGGSPMTAAKEVARRMDLDPSDPRYLTAAGGLALSRELASAASYDVRAERIGRDMKAMLGTPAAGAAPSPITPATERDDKPLLQNLAAAGVVDAVPDASGNPVLNRITDPTRFAFYAKGFARVPTDAADLIRAGLGAADAGQVREAGAAYAALYLQSPTLAQSINLEGTAALRARFIASRLERDGPVVVTNNAALRAGVNPLALMSLRMNPQWVQYSKDEVLGLVYYNDAAKGADPNFKADVQRQAAKDIREGAFASDDLQAAGVTPRRLFGLAGNARVDSVPANVAATYLDALADEVKFARSIMPDEAAAMKAAKSWALDRTLAAHPPQAWAGKVYFGASPAEIAVPESAIRQDITNSLGPSRGAEVLAELSAGYVPRYDAQQGGFVFHSLADPYVLYTIHYPARYDGNPEERAKMIHPAGDVPLVVNPTVPAGKSDAELTAEIQRTITAERARRAAAPPKRSPFLPAQVPGETDDTYMRRISRPRFGGLE